MKCRGFSLLETLVTLGLLALSMGIITDLIQDLIRLQQEVGRSSVRRQAQNSLIHIGQEIEQASQLVLPSSGSSGSVLETRRVTHDIYNQPDLVWPAPRFGESLPIFHTNGLSVFTTRIYLETTTLTLRSQTSVLAEGIKEFEVRRQVGGPVSLRLELDRPGNPLRLNVYRETSW